MLTGSQEHEGHGGWTIAGVTDAARNIVSLGIRPNLVLIHVGTNDCLQWVANPSSPANDPGTASTRMLQLVSVLRAGIPDVTIIVSTLVPNKDARVDACVQAVNAGIVKAIYAAKFPKVYLVDMHDGFITTADLADQTHPNDLGYAKMAENWWNLIHNVIGVISPPANTGTPDSTSNSGGTAPSVCPKIFGFSDSNGGDGHQTQAGSGSDDGPYTHHGTSQGTITLTQVSFGPTVSGDVFAGYNFAQLVNYGGALRGGEVDELVSVSWSASAGYSYYFWLNYNSNSFSSRYSFQPPFNCKPEGKIIHVMHLII